MNKPRYYCPKPNCGAGVDSLTMMWGGIRKKEGKIRAKMLIKCERCRGVHTAILTDEKAMRVFIYLDGTDKFLNDNPDVAARFKPIIKAQERSFFRDDWQELAGVRAYI